MDLIESQRQINELRARKIPDVGGENQLQGPGDFSARLQNKDVEIRKLRTECDTIAAQYEELALKSLHLASQDNSLTESQKHELEKLKEQLQKSSSELELKRAECQMLEDYCMELDDKHEIEDANEDVINSLKDLEEIGTRHWEICSQVEELCGDDISQELAALRERLAEAEVLLSDTRKDYSEIMEQFVLLSQEDSELRDINIKLKSECKNLRREVESLQEEAHSTYHS